MSFTPVQQHEIIAAFKASKSKSQGLRTAFNLAGFLAALETGIGDAGPFLADIFALLQASGLITPAPAPPTPPAPPASS